MGERDVVWEHGENLFSGFKCKYCVKEFRGGGVTRLKEHLARESGNVARCTKYPSDILDYFLRELQRVRERRRSKMMKCSIECKAQFQNSMMKMRNCRRC
jgi:hypothetical protein